ncbi:hypothetical protein [uncultured Roseobacter sp.]|uniref:hypothetical protein n=1 Tax=uncultured Roseobacter sp. TaxID=114847 RepID=UPI0026154963|nr:hypothetical protein [uncultured Roseobacter sp.]
MLDDAGSGQVIGRLDHMLNSGQLTPALTQQARALRDRLCAGVRVVILGPKGIGKSQLRDVLLGETAPAMPSSAFALSIGHTDARAEQIQDPNVHTETLHNPFLELATVMDVAASEGTEMFSERIRWALSQADIAVWCTQCFSEEEAALWAQASEHLKDHSFLVLTKADALASVGTLQSQIANLQAVAAEEFHSFFPTSTFHAHKALRAGDEISETQLAASGVKALRQTLSDLAASGQRADVDRALLFLQRNETQDAAVSVPAPGKKKVTPQTHTYEKALALLRGRVADLTTAAPQPDAVLENCSTLVEDLAELAAAQTQSDASFDAWRNDLYEASDKVVLMSLENDLRSAADATTIILQLKRDLDIRLAH